MKDLSNFLESNISDELLAAYIDGNATENEILLIEKSLKNDSLLSETIDIVHDGQYFKESLEWDNDKINHVGDLNILSDLLEYGSEKTDEYESHIINDIKLEQMKYNFSLFNREEANNGSPELSNGAKAAKQIFGEEGNGKSNPLLEIYQGYDSTCAIRSQQIILRDYGIDLSQEDLMVFAEQNGWFSEENGTPIGYVGFILQSQGVTVHQKEDSTIYDLINELAQGHRIIVGVDSGELWADRNGNIWEQTKEFFEDLWYGQKGADHALIVAGIEVNPKDPSDVTVILTDPGTGDLRIEYTLDQFMDAWEDSNCFMVATDFPAPYQYDETRGVMVPSNFVCQEFIDNNTYPLSPDALYIPEGYTVASAYYDEGHLDIVGHDEEGNVISYKEYDGKYKQALGSAGAFGQEHFNKDEFVKAMKGLFGFKDDDTVHDGQIKRFSDDDTHTHQHDDQHGSHHFEEYNDDDDGIEDTLDNE